MGKRKYTVFEIVQALNKIITLNISIDENGEKFIKEFDNMYYVSKFIQTSSNSLDAYYSANKIEEKTRNFLDLYIFDFIESFLEFLNTTKLDIQKIKEILKTNLDALSIENQEILLEETKLSELRESSRYPIARKFILDYFEPWIKKITKDEETIYVSTLQDQFNLRCLNEDKIRKITNPSNCKGL